MADFRPIRALGAMSGTSLDGVDAAVIETDGVTITGFGDSAYRPYDDGERAVLRAALGQWSGAEVAAAADMVAQTHADALAGFDCDLVGMHGQTLVHAPRAQGTLQVGDGAALAARLGKPVVWDFRSADVAAGGEGAPLAPVYHHACARWCGASEPLGFLNLGGVGNLTYVDPRCDAPDADGALLAFDTGPANAPLNDLMMARRGVALDQGGVLAATGRVDPDVVRAFLRAPYFSRRPPKSLDRDDFPDLLPSVADLSDADAAATLTALVAASVADGLRHLPSPPSRILVTGGGRLNPVMMRHLAQALPCPVDPVEAVGLDGDMLEAQAFAFMAVRVLRGLPISMPGTTGAPRAIVGGRISDPAASDTRA
ncbi:MAG: anhydro-N-acetylmuramic acid kinase [Marinibacterium sp.]|nr:anhydro-N-acetylmuramic acid kinase [Marinibacterium sp.]